MFGNRNEKWNGAWRCCTGFSLALFLLPVAAHAASAISKVPGRPVEAAQAGPSALTFANGAGPQRPGFLGGGYYSLELQSGSSGANQFCTFFSSPNGNGKGSWQTVGEPYNYFGQYYVLGKQLRFFGSLSYGSSQYLMLDVQGKIKGSGSTGDFDEGNLAGALIGSGTSTLTALRSSCDPSGDAIGLPVPSGAFGAAPRQVTSRPMAGISIRPEKKSAFGGYYGWYLYSGLPSGSPTYICTYFGPRNNEGFGFWLTVESASSGYSGQYRLSGKQLRMWGVYAYTFSSGSTEYLIFDVQGKLKGSGAEGDYDLGSWEGALYDLGTSEFTSMPSSAACESGRSS